MPPLMVMPMVASMPASPLSEQAAAVTAPPLITSQPLESMPSPSPVSPVTWMFTEPPLTVVTDTLSSLVLMPSLPEVMLMVPPLMVRCSSVSSPSLSAVMFSTPVPASPPSTFMDILE